MARIDAIAPGASKGFTILEQAVSLSVIALLLGSVMIPLKTQIENRKIDETKRSLETAQELLLGFAAAHGYFPCPATATSAGREPQGTDHVTGGCPAWHGFLPAALLGYRPVDGQGYAIDGWEGASNRIRYAVANTAVAGVPHTLTRANGLRSVSLGNLATTPLYYICQSGSGATANDCGAAVTLASNAAVVVWSVGPNGATGGTSAHEEQNPNPNGGSADRIFVSRGHSSVGGHEFDDIVTWIPATALVSRLVLAGQFPPAGPVPVSPGAAQAR
jgi:type II secretory pathway pseudopilin PulG